MVPAKEIDIGKAVARLDEAVPRESAWVAFFQYGGGPDECAVYASRGGYLRLGIEFLKAGVDVSESSTDEQYVQVDLNYLVDEKQSHISFDYFKVVPPDRAWARADGQKRRRFWGAALGGLVSLAFFAVFIVGLISIVRWLVAWHADGPDGAGDLPETDEPPASKAAASLLVACCADGLHLVAAQPSEHQLHLTCASAKRLCRRPEGATRTYCY